MRHQLNRILCSTDFSDLSDQTIPYGIALAKAFGAKLFISHIIDLPFAAVDGGMPIDPGEQQDRMTAFAYKHLEPFFEGTTVSWEPWIATGNTADELMQLVHRKRIDLVISATHGRSGLKRFLLGSVAEKLMRVLPCPLLIIKAKPDGPEKIEFSLRRILVGCDFSADSDLAFQYGLGLAQEFEAELHLVHVLEPPAYPDAEAALTESRNAMRAQIREKLDRMVPEEARNWCRPIVTLREGKPDEELSRYAEINEMDLMVLGVHGHSLVEALFIGSTTDRVARRSPCPVLAVRPLPPKEG